MKAEERKELETNLLADRVGHLMQNVRTQPRRSSLYYAIGLVVVLIVVVVGVRWYQQSVEEESDRWRLLDIETLQALEILASKQGDTNAGRAARFQLAWLAYWEFGVKRLAFPNAGADALSYLDKAAGQYRQLAEECAGDPIWEPEALYGQAIIEEANAVVDLKRLDSAKRMYEDLANKHKESARGKLAQKWLDNYGTPEGRRELENFYQQLQSGLNLVDPREMLRKNQPLPPPVRKK